MADFNIHTAKIGDALRVTRDGHTSDMVIWRIDAPGTAGTSYAAGPHIAVWIRPGGYGMTFDASHLADGRVTVEKL